MSDEQEKPVNAPEQIAPEQAPEEPQISEVETAARAQGWVPKEEWSGPPEKWRPADVFVDRGELLGKIKSQSQEMRELRDMLNHLSEQNRRLYEAGYEKAIHELQSLRDQAIEAGDRQAVRDLDKEIRAHEAAKAEASKPVTVKQQNNLEENFRQFVTRNRWYEQNERMQDWANGRAVKYRTQHPNSTDVEVYEHLEEEARKHYPEYFRKVGAPSPDGKGDRSGVSTPKARGGDEFEELLANLTEEQASIARNLVKRQVISKEKYVQDLKAIGGIR